MGELRRLDRTQPRRPRGFAGELGLQELTILSCLANGLTLADTAETLHLGYGAVHDALRRSRSTLDARTTAHAVAIALRGGLIA